MRSIEITVRIDGSEVFALQGGDGILLPLEPAERGAVLSALAEAMVALTGTRERHTESPSGRPQLSVVRS